MNREQFNRLVRRLEQFAARHPSQYKLRCATLALLGYGYLLAVLVITLGLLALIVATIIHTGRLSGLLQILFVLMVFTGMILRSLWVRFPPPEAIALSQADAPRLFELVDQMRRHLKTPPIHEIALDGSFNAGVLQRPRLGWLGWHRNHLLLGLPLMQALSPEQFRAVLAHELGHLSGNHGRFNSWIYRVRQSWDRLLDHLQRSGRGTWLFDRFLRWFAPRFNAYSFVLARTHEYEADRCSVEFAGATHAATALVATQLQSRRLTDIFWPSIYQQIRTSATPPTELFGAMAQSLRAPLPPQHDRWRRDALRVETSNDDTHPSLSDRLRHLGLNASEIESSPLTISAAEYFLGEQLDEHIARLDQRWRAEVEPQWRERHQQAQQEQQELAALDERAAREPLPLDDVFRRAQLAQAYRGDEAAIPLYREILAAQPDHPGANFQLGQCLLARDDETGLAHVERAMTQDCAATLPGCQVLCDYFQRHDRDDDANRYRQRAEQFQDLLALAQQERAVVTARDTFAPHGLDAELLRALRERLIEYAEIDTVYLARKVVEYLPQKPFFVMVVVRTRTWRDRFRGDDAARNALAECLVNKVRLPWGDGQISVVSGHRHPLVRTLRRIPHSIIYPA